MSDDRLHCALCPYTAPLMTPEGKVSKVGYAMMASHSESAHAEEHKLVQKGLSELDEDIRVAEEEAEGNY